MTFPGEPTETDMGSFQVEDGFLILADDDEPNDPARLRFTNWGDGVFGLVGDDEYDFDDDGNSEPAAVVYGFEQIGGLGVVCDTGTAITLALALSSEALMALQRVEFRIR